MKIKISIVLIFLVILFFSLVSYFIWEGINLKSDKATKTQEVLVIKEKETAKNDIAMSDYEKRKKAIKDKNTALCKELKSPEDGECISDIASEYGDIKYCSEILDEGIKRHCDELFVYEKIVASAYYGDCLSLSTGYKENCLDNFFWQWNDLGKCKDLPVINKVRCQDIINRKLAYSEDNNKICDKINDKSLRDDCRIVVISKSDDSDNDGIFDQLELSYGTDPFKADTDSDGLTDIEELSKYNTNPKNPDTDGDGYVDGDEINKYHTNPLSSDSKPSL